MGPSQFDWVGLTMTWSVANELHKNKVPTLIINGVNEGADEESQKTMAAGVKDSKSTKFKDSRHMLHWEERDRFMKTVGEWLKE
jgi:pimeloyl-ACP methyl ester carboxylesterase